MSRKWSLVIGKQRVTLEITRAIRRKPKAAAIKERLEPEEQR